MTERLKRRGPVWIWGLLAGLLLFAAIPVRISATAVTNSVKEGVDVIFLIDTSGSMRYSDSERTALESARMFVDMLEMSHSRVGVVAFTDTVDRVVPLTALNNTTDKETVKKAINRLTYNGYTDIGLSLMEAAAMISESSEDAGQAMIVLLTDGLTEINPNNTTRTEADSYADVETVLAALQGQVPIYTIGLDYNDNVDQAFLQRIADSTQAHTYITKDAAELPHIFNQIFADYIHSSLTEVAAFTQDGRSFENVEINIDNVFATETNIVILSALRLYDILLVNPEGRTVAFDGERYSISKSNQYTLVKLMSPSTGSWVVRVKGQYNDPIRVNVINNYNADITVSIVQENATGLLFDPGRPIAIQAAVASFNAQYPDLSEYADKEINLCVYDAQMKLIDVIPMEGDGNIFNTLYQPEGDVALSVQVKNIDFVKNSAFYAILLDKPLLIPEETEEPAAPDTEPEEAETVEPPVTVSETEAPPAQTDSPAFYDTVSAMAQRLLSPTVISGLSVAGVAALVIIGIALLRKRSAKGLEIQGAFVLRAMTADGVPTETATFALEDFNQKERLYDYLVAHLDGNGMRILMVPVDLDGITIKPGRRKKQPVIILTNNRHCEISNDKNYIMTHKNIVWPENRRLTFVNNDSEDMSHIEITFKAEPKAEPGL